MKKFIKECEECQGNGKTYTNSTWDNDPQYDKVAATVPAVIAYPLKVTTTAGRAIGADMITPATAPIMIDIFCTFLQNLGVLAHHLCFMLILLVVLLLVSLLTE